MKMIANFGVVLCLALSSAGVSGELSPGPEWVEVSRSPEITVYRKEMPGSPIFAYRGEAEIQAPLDKVVAVVTDTERRTEWAERVKVARVVQRISPLEKIEYVATQVPWPLKDRDFVVHSRLIPDRQAKTLRIEVRSTETPLSPLMPNHVRGWIYRSDFVLRSVDEGRKTHISSETHLDPKGAVPAWIINFVQKSFPQKSVANLLKQAKRSDISSSRLVAEYDLMSNEIR